MQACVSGEMLPRQRSSYEGRFKKVCPSGPVVQEVEYRRPNFRVHNACDESRPTRPRGTE